MGMGQWAKVLVATRWDGHRNLPRPQDLGFVQNPRVAGRVLRVTHRLTLRRTVCHVFEP